MRRLLPWLASLTVLAAAPLGAALPPAGPDFHVSTTSLSNQAGIDVARDAAGDSVYVWIDQAIVPQGVLARIFNAAGVAQQFFVLVALDNQPLSAPRVAMTPQGEFVVVWSNPNTVFLRRFDRTGQAIGPGTVTQQPTLGSPQSPDVAIDPAGNVAVIWNLHKIDGDILYLQKFDAADRPLGAPEAVNAGALGTRTFPRVVYGPAGTLLVTWTDDRAGGSSLDVFARRYDGPSGSWAPEFRVNELSPGSQAGSAPLLDTQGNGAVIYVDLSASKLLVRRVGSDGTPSGNSLTLSDQVALGGIAPDAALASDGTVLVAWEQNDLLVHVQFFDSGTSAPLSDDMLASSVQTDAEIDPVVAAGGGGFSVAWTSIGQGGFFPTIPPPSAFNGRDGDGMGIYARQFQAPLCAAGSETLCLNGGRFHAQVSWKNPYTGATGTGKSLPLTGDTGAFWFFNQDNLELMVKILDGGFVNQHFWVFYGSLSNVEYTLTVTDTVTNATRTYHNAPLQLASGSDVEAFFSPVVDPPPPSLEATAVDAPAPALAEKAGVPGGTCAASPSVLCLDGKHYSAEVEFVDPRDGSHGTGRAVALTDDSGSFWFFGPDNLELMVKVLDGTGINGHHWVIFGALSDVEYTLTVTELATGKKKTYHNAPHHQASVQDLEAF